MKKRIKNWITSIIGTIVMLSATFMYFFGDDVIGFIEYITLLVLGWVFLSAKDTLLEGVFFKLFKIKKDERS